MTQGNPARQHQKANCVRKCRTASVPTTSCSRLGCPQVDAIGIFRQSSTSITPAIFQKVTAVITSFLNSMVQSVQNELWELS